jgi:hypothetical protein
MANEKDQTRRIVSDPNAALVGGAPAEAETVPVGSRRTPPPPPQTVPSDGNAEAIRSLQDQAIQARDLFSQLWNFCEDIKPADPDVRKLKLVCQAMCKYFRDEAEKAHLQMRSLVVVPQSTDGQDATAK